jgi:tetratricopeptide (TPR) repeat protein
LAQWLLAFFFCVLAAATACHAILQYHYVYPLRFEELRATAALQPNDPLLEGVTHALRTGRVSSWFGNPNVFCGFLAMCLPFLAAAGWSARGRWRWAVRIAAAGVAGALFYAAFRTGSAGGNLVLIAGVLLLGAAFLLRKRAAAGMGTKVCSAGFSLSSFLFLCACLFLGGGKPGAPEVVAGEGVSRTQAPSPQHSVLTTQSSVLTTQPSALSPPSSALSPQPSALSPQHSALSTQHSALTTQRSALSTLPEGPRQSRTILQRVYYLRSGLAMWRERPFVGHGAGAYARLYPRTRIPGAGETRYAHNFLVQLAVELGLVGVGLFVWVLLLAVKRFAEGLRSGQANALWVCTGISLLLFLLDSLGDYTFYVREIYLDFCLLLGAFVAAAPPPAGPPARQSASLPVGQSASRPVCQSASRPVGQSAGMPVYEPTFHPSSFALHPSFLSTQHSALGTLLLLAGGVLLVLAGLWLEIVPAQMAAHHRQITEDLWTAAADAGREGKAMQQRGLMEDALRQADRALSWQPGNPWLWQLRANAYGSVGRPDAMRYDLQRAISLHPDSAALRAGLADLEWRQGEQRSLGEDARREARARAMELLRQALALYPLKSGLHEQHARYLAESGKGKEALEAARVAVRLAFTPLEIESARKTLQEIEKAELTTETQRHRE